MQAISMMTKILGNGNKVVVANRGGNRIIQLFTPRGRLLQTKVKTSQEKLLVIKK